MFSIMYLSDSVYQYILLMCTLACRILVPQPGIEPGPRLWKRRVLTTGPPGNSQYQYILERVSIVQIEFKRTSFWSLEIWINHNVLFCAFYIQELVLIRISCPLTGSSIWELSRIITLFFFFLSFISLEHLRVILPLPFPE